MAEARKTEEPESGGPEKEGETREPEPGGPEEAEKTRELTVAPTLLLS